MSLSIYTHKDCLLHDTGPGCEESPERLQVILDLLQEAPFNSLPVLTPAEVKKEALHRAHRPYFVEALHKAMPKEGRIVLNDDTPVAPGTWHAAMLAAGAACQAVEDVTSGKSKRVFSAMRPPGHHAAAARSEGFCLFNNVIIGALHAQATCGVKKVAIVDFDVHQGNGSDVLAREHKNIFYISSHQWPIYPTMGLPEENLKDRIMNILLYAGDGSKEFRTAYETQVFPALEAFKPDLVMISAGFDAHKDDPLAQINLVEDDYTWVTEKLRDIADRHCGGRLVSLLEGGYNTDALKRSVAAHLKALM